MVSVAFGAAALIVFRNLSSAARLSAGALAKYLSTSAISTSFARDHHPPPGCAMQALTHGAKRLVHRRRDTFDRVDPFAPARAPPGDDRDRVAVAGAGPDDARAVHAPALVARVPPVFEPHAVARIRARAGSDAPALLRDDAVEHP